MKLFASIAVEQWKPEFVTRGIKLGEVEGETGHPPRPVIWVQHYPFPMGCNDFQMKIVEFNAPISDVFIDLDDFELDVDLDWRYTLEELDKCREAGTDISWDRYTEQELDKAILYGAYVLAIKPEQIVAIHEAHWADGQFFMDGKPD